MRTVFAFLLTALLMPIPAHALESLSVSADHIAAHLLSSTQAVGAQPTIDAALVLQLEDGWHTYWRSPGDSGLAPVFDWSASENIADVALFWPTAKRYDEYGLQVFGYHGTPVFPLLVTLEEPGKAAVISAQISALVCKDICIPQNLNVSLEIPAGDAQESPAASEIMAAKKNVPYLQNLPDLQIKNVTAGPKGIVVDTYSEDGFAEADVFIELNEGALTAKPTITPDTKDPRNAQIMVAAPEAVTDFFETVKDQPVTLTFTNGEKAVVRTINF